MADIIDYNEPWDGRHDGNEVEKFIKQELLRAHARLDGKVGFVEYTGNTIVFWDDENKGNKVGEITLSGDIYRVTLVTDPSETSFNVLSSAAAAILTFSASTQKGDISGGEWQAYSEDYTYTISVDNGSGTYRKVKEGTLLDGSSVSENVKSSLTTGQNRLRLTVVGNESGQQTTKIFNVNVTTLTLTCNFSWYRAWVQGEAFAIDRIYFAGNLQKTLYVAFDGDLLNPVKSLPFTAGQNYDDAPLTVDLTNDWPEGWEGSGIHTVTLWMEGGGVSTPSYTFNVMCVASEEKGTAQLIAINERLDVVSNYVSQKFFAYALYGVTEVTFTQVVTDGESTVQTEDTVRGIVTQTKNQYNSLVEFETESDAATVTVNAVAGEAQEQVTFQLDNSTAYLPTEGATFYMNAATRSNNSSDRLYIKNQAHDAQTEQFLGEWRGFSFGSTDGWISESANTPTVLAAKAGCHVKFPTLELLSTANSDNTNHGATLEMKIMSSNIADYDTPVMSFGAPSSPEVVASPTGSPRERGYYERYALGDGKYSFAPSFDTEVDGGKTYYRSAAGTSDIGVYVYPTKLTVLNSSAADSVLQSIGLQEGVVHHLAVVFQRDYGGTTGRNLCSIYMNGNRNIHFSFNSDSSFGTGSLTIGQDSTDFSLYMIRFYDKPLSSADVLANFVNTIIDGVEFTRSGVRNSNAVIDNGTIDYEMARKSGLACMVVESDYIPSVNNSSDRYGTLRMEYGMDDTRNFTVTNVRISGQGTTSMSYYRWNLRFRPQGSSVWSYAGGSTTTGKKGWFDGRNVHPQVSDIVAKKNYASAMQGHKIGAVNFYDDLYKQYVGTGGLPDGARVSVYQYPVLGFQKVGDVYTYIGLYTIGPHKGDKGTFGYGQAAYPSLMSIEGPNHAPLGTRFLHPWQDVDYDYANETLTFGGEEAWDADFIGSPNSSDDYSTKTDKEENKAAILALYEREWRPAYDMVFFCSPYLKKFSELGSSYDTLAKVNANVAAFRDGSTDGVKNNLLQLYDDSYRLYAYNNARQGYVEVTQVNEAKNGTVSTFNMLTYLEDYLFSATPSTSDLIDARITKFRVEANTFWNVKSMLFHYLFCILIAATDNFAKNMYPFKFKPLSEGGLWAFRQDDMDSILDTDNNGQQTKKYSVMPGDTNARGVQLFQGGESVLWELVRRCWAENMKSNMLDLINGCVAIANDKGITVAATLHDTIYNVFAYYFWSRTAKYFPAEAYNHDTVWSYITPWHIDPTKSYNSVYPLTQARGDAQYSEREWLRKRIAYLFSCYVIGGFAGSSQDYNNIALTPAERFTFNIVPAIDLYPVANKGGGNVIQGARTQAGQACPLSVDSDGATTVYIEGMDWVSYLGDMSGLVLDTRGGAETAGLGLTGKRLRKVKIGDAVASAVKFNGVSITLSNTPALEEFDARNVTSLSNFVVDLSKCKRMRKILLEGSTAAGLLIPEGAQLERISMPDSLNTLFLRSLPNITYEMLEMSATTKGTIVNLYIYNCPLLDPIALLTDLWARVGNLANITMTWDQAITCQPNAFLALYYIAQGKAYVSGSGTTADPYIVEDRAYGYLSYVDGTVTPVTGTPVIEGVVNVDGYVDAEQWELLHATWPNLTINCTGRIIKFEDAVAKQICVDNWGGATGGSTGVAGVAGELTMEQAAKVSSLGTKLYNRHDIASFAEWYYFGQTAGTRDGDIIGSAYNSRSGKYDLVVTPKNFVANNANGMSCISNTNADTIVVPHITTMNQYFSYGLACTNLIVLDDTAPSIVNQAGTGRSVTNVYVPDDLVSIYGSRLGASAKPLSQFIAGSSPYAAMVKTLYENGILVRDWLDEE